MTPKRVLVVDDSRSARISLQKLLQNYRIEADFAESGEDALDYLKHHLVDAIFMDHTMPGMDGLETVVAIKSNPRTATIPVMMYTAKEGEVYVSQARALGAIGVLPKQVQPGVLEQMLEQLGLIRHASPSADGLDGNPVGPLAAPEAQEQWPNGRHPEAAVDPEYDQQALSASVQALITRTLNEQHLQLRSDILTAHREFARQVAGEILARERAAEPAAAPAAAVPEAKPAARGISPLTAWLLFVAVLVLGGLVWQQRGERDRLAGEIAALAAVNAEQEAALEALARDRRSDFDAARANADDRFLGLIQAMEWALNQDSRVGFADPAFDDARSVELERLLQQLVNVGFRGTVQMESHLGEFCLVADAETGYRLASPDALLDACSLLGHPLDDSSFPDTRQSAAFAGFLWRSPLVLEHGIDVEVIALDRAGSVAVQAMPPNATTAGEWNDFASRNHRVQYRLIPVVE